LGGPDWGAPARIVRTQIKTLVPFNRPRRAPGAALRVKIRIQKKVTRLIEKVLAI
jgi:hypothetical protein